MNVLSGAHSVSRIGYHLVWCPKYRGSVLGGYIGRVCDRLLRAICRERGVEVIASAVAPDHVHLMVQCGPDVRPSDLVRRLKGKSSRILRDAFPELVRWCPEALWQRGSFIDSVGHGQERVESYIREQSPRYCMEHASSAPSASAGAAGRS
jgi:putative transposase